MESIKYKNSHVMIKILSIDDSNNNLTSLNTILKTHFLIL